MFVTVFVDNETFKSDVLGGKKFEALLNPEEEVSVAVLVPINSVYVHSQYKDMVIITVQPKG